MTGFTRRAVMAGGMAALALPGLASPLRGLAQASVSLPPDWTARLSQGGWLRGVAPAGAAALALDGVPLPLASDRGFLIGFDRDAPATSMLTITDSAGAVSQVPLSVAPRDWQIERVDAPLRPPGVPDAEFLARRATERAQIDAARAQRTTAQGWRQAMVQPAPGRFSGRFGAQRIYRGQPGAYHGGLDMASPTGTPFVAPADGVVVLAAEAPFTLEGRLLMLDHGMGLGSAFLHCSSHLVRVGEAVSRGQPLGTVGMTGRATGPHLHWALAWQMGTVMRRLDPLLFLG
ncbi:M23 family metallopeptidase [Novosphingobium capsulatum]|uniref:M23 family metallopeptidase n=1 Tax=Novosphingobium capsulatum TaxID=13688 RepID=UPI0007894D59|nr:M23 family metallopeptidase [Novosphingobium capsulatum]WQD93417.1 M23 family metallopeptidase [Novosphingobium capsulatum]